MRLTEEQENKIKQLVEQHQFKVPGLADDIIDHLCCYLEFEGKEKLDFDSQLEEAVQLLAPTGLASLEQQTLFLLNANKIILMKRFFFTLGLVSSMALSMGLLFKLMHWPGANVMLLSGSVLFLLVFLPFWTLDKFKFKMAKNSFDRWRLLSGLGAGVLFGLSVVFKALHLMGAPWLLVASILIFVVLFLPFYFFKIYRKSLGTEEEA